MILLRLLFCRNYFTGTCNSSETPTTFYDIKIWFFLKIANANELKHMDKDFICLLSFTMSNHWAVAGGSLWIHFLVIAFWLAVIGILINHPPPPTPKMHPVKSWGTSKIKLYRVISDIFLAQVPYWTRPDMLSTMLSPHFLQNDHPKIHKVPNSRIPAGIKRLLFSIETHRSSGRPHI